MIEDVLSPNIPDPSSLDLLSSVNELGSLGQAAIRHRISQPAVSGKMRQLERQLGLKLLSRGPKGTQLTPVGKEMVKYSQGVLSAIEAMMAASAMLRAELDGHLRVAASFTVAEYLLGSWMEKLSAEHPNIVLTLEVSNSARVLERVSDVTVDIGFIEGIGADLSSLNSVVVGADRLVLLVDPTHPWAKRANPVSGFELAERELLTREFGSGTREVLEAALGQWGGFHSRHELGSTTAILRAVRSGGGPAVVSSIAASDDIDDGRLVEVKTEGINLTRNFHAIWDTSRPLSRHAKYLLGIARSRVANDLSP